MRNPLLVCLLLWPLGALADQAAWVSAAQAEKAAKLMPAGTVVANLCEPCHESMCKLDTVVDVWVQPTDGNYNEVVINSESKDLAYLFTMDKGRWTNIAMRLKLPVKDVSRTLSNNQCAPPGSPNAVAAVVASQTGPNSGLPPAQGQNATGTDQRRQAPPDPTRIISVPDLSALVQTALDDRAISGFYHTESVAGRVPLILRSTDEVNPNTVQGLTKFGQPVRILSPSEIAQQGIHGFMILRNFKRLGKAVSFVLEYTPENAAVTYTAEQIKNQWVVKPSQIMEF